MRYAVAWLLWCSSLNYRDLVRPWTRAVSNRIINLSPHFIAGAAIQEDAVTIKDRVMNLILLIVLVVLLLGALPAWPYSADWGYYPSGALGTVLIIVLVLALLGRSWLRRGGRPSSSVLILRSLVLVASLFDRSSQGPHRSAELRAR